MIEVGHHLLELALRHLAVPDPDARLRNEFRQLFLDLADVLDAVVNEIHLAAALDLAQAGLAHDDVVPFRDEGLDGQALRGRCRDQRHLAEAAERHVQRARDWRRGESQHVDLAPQRANRLLVPNAETVFLVDDHEPDVLEVLRVLQEAVRADDDVDGAVSHALDDAPDLACALETGQHLDADGPVRETVAEVLAVLLREQRRRHEDRDLLVVVHGGEGGAQRNLGLAEADVAAHDAVHRLVRAQVGQHVADGPALVLGQFEREAVLERTVLALAPAEAVSRPRGTPRVDVEQFGRNVTNLLDRALARPGPLVAAEPVQRRGCGRGARVARDQLERVDRDVELVAVGVFEHEELGGNSAGGQRLETEVAADAVFRVYDRRACLEVAELADDRLGIAVVVALALLLPHAVAEQLLLADQRKLRLGQEHAAVYRCDGDADPFRCRQEAGPALALGEVEPAAEEEIVHLFAAPRRVGREQHAAVETVKERDQLGCRVFVARFDLERGRQLRREIDRVRRLGQ